jgi:hypothetical protein
MKILFKKCKLTATDQSSAALRDFQQHASDSLTRHEWSEAHSTTKPSARGGNVPVKSVNDAISILALSPPYWT